VITNCILSPDIDVDKLPMFDLDYLWIKLRCKSVQEIVQIPFECRHQLPNGETRVDEDGDTVDYCGTIVNVAVNLEEVEVRRDPKNNPKIELEPGIGIVMKYPTFEMATRLAKMDSENVQTVFETIMDCVELIWDGEKTYERELIDKKELQEFLETLSQQQFQKIMDFFETIPVLSHKVHFKCPKCKHEVDMVIEGTKSFLASDSPTNQ
jgi:hypothetical protein